jgi:hypothetical protein
MRKPDFSDARQRLGRAREHIAESQTRIANLINPEFYRVEPHFDSQAGRVRIDLISLQQSDKGLNCTIGDAIGNLRTVLDYAAVALVAPIAGKTQSVGFPFADDANGFTGTVTKGTLSVCAETVRQYFIDEVQAYKGGKGETFWTLNKLRNIEKHRFLLATRELVGVIASWRVGKYICTNNSLRVVAGDRRTFLDAPADIEFTDKIHPTIQVFLNEPPYVPHAPAISFLNGLTSDVERFLNAIEVIA